MRGSEPDAPPPVDPRQRPLFPEAPPSAPYQPHSDTSRAAAASQPRADLAARQRQVLAAIAVGWASGRPGMTDEEITTRTGLAPNSVRPRRVELVARGLVKDSGMRRPTVSGRQATVWVTA